MAIAPAGAKRSPANLHELAAARKLETTGLGRASVALWLIAIAGLSFVLRIALLDEEALARFELQHFAKSLRDLRLPDSEGPSRDLRISLQYEPPPPRPPRSDGFRLIAFDECGACDLASYPPLKL